MSSNERNIADLNIAMFYFSNEMKRSSGVESVGCTALALDDLSYVDALALKKEGAHRKYIRVVCRVFCLKQKREYCFTE